MPTPPETDPRAELEALRRRIREEIDRHRARGWQPTDSYVGQVLRELLEGQN